jgi:hypothetical protein
MGFPADLIRSWHRCGISLMRTDPFYCNFAPFILQNLLKLLKGSPLLRPMTTYGLRLGNQVAREL